MRQITINQFLTPAEIERAIALYKSMPSSDDSFVDVFLGEIITPNMARINTALGQENDPRYLAYVVEFVIGEVLKGGQ